MKTARLWAWFLVGLLLVAFVLPAFGGEPGDEFVPLIKIIKDLFGQEIQVPVEVPDRDDFILLGINQKDGVVFFLYGRNLDSKPVYVEGYASTGGDPALLMIGWSDASGVTQMAYDRFLDSLEDQEPSGVFKMKTPDQKKEEPVEPKNPDPAKIHFSI